MRRLAEKYLYDTQRARKIATTVDFVRGDYGPNRDWRTSLYRTENGRWFLRHEIWSRVGWLSAKLGENPHIVEEQLEPITLLEAQDWAFKHGVNFSDAGIPEPEEA